MTLTIGRCGLLVSMDDPEVVEMNSDGTLHLAGEIVGSSLANAQALRMQLLGAVGPKAFERVVPVTWSEDATVTGWYRVRSCQVTYPQLALAVFTFAYELELEQMPHFQAVRAFARSQSRERTGAGGVTEDPWLAVPSDCYGLDLAGDPAVYFTRTGPGGSVRMYVDSSLAASGAVSYEIAPADWHDMRAYLKVDGQEVTGDYVQSIGNATDWEFANGFIRVRNGATTADAFRLAGPVPAAPSVYGTDYAFRYGLYLSSAMRTMSPTSIQLRRLTLELAQIRLRGYVNTASTDDDYTVQLDITMRRGGSYVECVGSSIVSAIHRLDDTATPGLTVVTAGKTEHRTSNDGDGNRWWLASGTTLNTGLSASGSTRTNSSVTQWPFGLGIELNGSSSVEPNRVADQFDHYWADQSVVWEFGA